MVRDIHSGFRTFLQVEKMDEIKVLSKFCFTFLDVKSINNSISHAVSLKNKHEVTKEIFRIQSSKWEIQRNISLMQLCADLLYTYILICISSDRAITT